jgi:hypothetical protein
MVNQRFHTAEESDATTVCYDSIAMCSGPHSVSMIDDHIPRAISEPIACALVLGLPPGCFCFDRRPTGRSGAFKQTASASWGGLLTEASHRIALSDVVIVTHRLQEYVPCHLRRNASASFQMLLLLMAPR